MLYTESNFQLTLNGAHLELEPVGTQIDGDFLWIYQEFKLSSFPDGLRVTCTLLHELFAEEQNQVNLFHGELRSQQWGQSNEPRD